MFKDQVKETKELLAAQEQAAELAKDQELAQFLAERVAAELLAQGVIIKVEKPV